MISPRFSLVWKLTLRFTTLMNPKKPMMKMKIKKRAPTKNMKISYSITLMTKIRQMKNSIIRITRVRNTNYSSQSPFYPRMKATKMRSLQTYSLMKKKSGSLEPNGSKKSSLKLEKIRKQKAGPLGLKPKLAHY